MKKKKNNIGSKIKRKRELKPWVIRLFNENPMTTFEIKEIFRRLQLRTHPSKMLAVSILDDLLMGEFIKESPRFCYSLNRPVATEMTNDEAMHAILAEFDLPHSYPQMVEEEAEKIEPGITDEEIARREDFRNTLTFTIDPRDAKDFDDALSIRQLKEGLWEVGVHIADVSHYVQEGSIIDKEAFKRATSVYLVDRTIPMLPERLCNFICSLRPDEDKLTYSVVFTLNENAEVQNWHLAHTIIRSDRRFTYEEVQSVFEGTPEVELPQELTQALHTLNSMAKQLRERRFAAGSVDFDRCEFGFELDQDGRPINVFFKESNDAHKLIEEFMLLANRTVAESIGKVPKNKTPKVLPYRIHEAPDPEKLSRLSDFVVKFGHKLKMGHCNEETSRNLNRLLSDVRGKKEQNVVELVTLRAMMKAKYSTDNIGHYGLAFDYYTHFTSPIRRYPDLMVHRLLTRYAQGGSSVSKERYEQFCEHSSKMEETAALAERASIKYKQVEFMSERLGQAYMGTISGVTEHGIYVEIDENKCEGFVPVHTIKGDYFYFDERNYRLLGKRTGHCYNLGDSVMVEVVKADLFKKQLDFKLVRK